ncbi:MAG: hypothetical protein HPY62_12590 [Bacteroidales bacterium]|nr:hypothetical protein [Bacteroidales bacterium]
MKTLIFLIITAISIQAEIYGQSGKPTGKQENDPVYARSFSDAKQINKDGIMQFQDTVIIKEPGQEIPRVHHKRNHGIPDNLYDSIASKRFPGSERFYARRPELLRPFDKPFIIPPASSSGNKYYLIIKDPITQRVIK